MKGALSRRKAQLGLGVLLGLLVVFAVVAPGLTKETPQESVDDPGRDMALSAGCDMSNSEVMMEVGEIDYILGYGSPSVEEAVVGFSGYLKQHGLALSQDTLRQAAATAEQDTIPVEVRLPGASLLVVQNGDAYVVGEVVLCA